MAGRALLRRTDGAWAVVLCAGPDLRTEDFLAQHGVTKSDRVFSLLGRVPELYIAALGTLKAGGVFSPLFSAFGRVFT